jgi:hypothetical protein
LRMMARLLMPFNNTPSRADRWTGYTATSEASTRAIIHSAVLYHAIITIKWTKRTVFVAAAAPQSSGRERVGQALLIQLQRHWND